MKLTTTLLIFFLSLNTYSQETDCSNFRIGTFRYCHPDFKNWKVVRTKTKQTETDTQNKIVIESTIEWISECEYELTYTSINEPESNSMIGEKIKVTIIKSFKNKIYCHTSSVHGEIDLEMIKN